MHLLVTDRLCCVRCGPEFGLVLLAEELTERRVLEGALGCANCRERYPVTGGFGDFRPPPRRPLADVGPAEGDDDPEEAIRLGALLGVTEGPGLLLLTGPAVRQAPRLAAMIDDIEVVALDPAMRGEPETSGVTRITAEARLPFFTGSLRGVVLEGGELAGEGLAGRLQEGIRVLAPGARLVVRRPPEGLARSLEEARLDVLLETPRAVVAVRG